MKSIFEEIGFDRASKLMADATTRAAQETAALSLPETGAIDGTSTFCYSQSVCCGLEKGLILGRHTEITKPGQPFNADVVSPRKILQKVNDRSGPLVADLVFSAEKSNYKWMALRLASECIYPDIYQ